MLSDVESASENLTAELLNQLRVLRDDASQVIFMAASASIAGLDPTLRTFFNDVVLDVII